MWFSFQICVICEICDTSYASDQPQRLISLDVFRGLTVAGMVLVNNPGTVVAHLLAARTRGMERLDARPI
jgi:hypothetical protein